MTHVKWVLSGHEFTESRTKYGPNTSMNYRVPPRCSNHQRRRHRSYPVVGVAMVPLIPLLEMGSRRLTDHTALVQCGTCERRSPWRQPLE